MVLIAQVVTRLYPKVGPRRLVAVGLGASALVAFAFNWVSLDTNIWVIRGLMFGLGLGIGFAMIPVQTATYATISPRNIGRATALFSTNRQVAGSFAVAIMATVLTSRTKSHISSGSTAQHGALLGFHDSFIVGGILLALGVAAAFLIKDEDAAATIGASPQCCSRRRSSRCRDSSRWLRSASPSCAW